MRKTIRSPLTQQGMATPDSPQGWEGPGRQRCKAIGLVRSAAASAASKQEARPDPVAGFVFSVLAFTISYYPPEPGPRKR